MGNRGGVAVFSGLALRRVLVFGVGVFQFGVAGAEAVPAGITEYLKTTQARLVMLHEGVLVVSLRRAVVAEDVFRTQVKGLCAAPAWNAKYSWGGARVEQIQFVNDATVQGFALLGGERSCRALMGLNEEGERAWWPTVQREIRAGRVQE